MHDNYSVTETKSPNEGLILNTALRHATIKINERESNQVVIPKYTVRSLVEYQLET